MKDTYNVQGRADDRGLHDATLSVAGPKGSLSDLVWECSEPRYEDS